MISFLRSYRFRLLVTLVLSPVVTVGFFVFFGYGSFVDQMEGRGLANVLQATQLQAEILEKNFDNFDRVVSAAFSEVQENGFEGESSLFNSNDYFAFFEVRNSEDKQDVRFQRAHPEYQVNFKNILHDFLISEHSYINEAGKRYLVVNKLFQQAKLTVTGVFHIKQRVLASETDKSIYLVVSELGEIVDGRLSLVEENVLASISQQFIKIHEGKDNGVKKAFLRGMGTVGIGYSRIRGSNDYLVNIVPGSVLASQSGFLLRNFLLLSVTIFCGILIMGLYLSNHLTTSLNKLVHAAHRMGSGDFDVIVSVPGKDEIAQLGDQFTAMARKISELFVDQKRKTILEQELKTAQLVQENFVPESEFKGSFYETSTFYRAAVQVGVDWWQIKEFNNGQQADIFLGDATGHGPAAAMVTSAATAMTKAVDFDRELSLKEYIQKFDFYTRQTFNDQVFMTMFFGRMKPGELEFYLASHEPALWLHVPLYWE